MNQHIQSVEYRDACSAFVSQIEKQERERAEALKIVANALKNMAVACQA